MHFLIIVFVSNSRLYQGSVPLEREFGQNVLLPWFGRGFSLFEIAADTVLHYFINNRLGKVGVIVGKI